MKFLKALQEDTGNIISYLVSMNIVNICLWRRVEGGTIDPGVKSPSPLNPHVCALHEHAGNNFSYLVPMNIVNAGGGDNLPWGKVPPPPHNPHVCFNFYVMIKGIEKSLII